MFERERLRKRKREQNQSEHPPPQKKKNTLRERERGTTRDERYLHHCPPTHFFYSQHCQHSPSFCLLAPVTLTHFRGDKAKKKNYEYKL